MSIDSSIEQIVGLFLLGLKDEQLIICSDIKRSVGPYQYFEVRNTLTDEKTRITFKIEEI